MSNKVRNKPLSKEKLTNIDSQWGEAPEDHFGYASEEERLAKRGMEDWELVNAIPDSQAPVPKWFFGVILVVLLVAIGLSFPFWGDREGYEREWFNWGFVIAIAYIAGASTFVYFMVKMYGSKLTGRLDSDSEQGEDKARPDDKKTQH